MNTLSKAGMAVLKFVHFIVVYPHVKLAELDKRHREHNQRVKASFKAIDAAIIARREVQFESAAWHEASAHIEDLFEEQSQIIKEKY